ncbi:MAG: polysaccharide deacetylase [Lachnospiraceae bacterium]|jgi:peptidoglycan/xylan/chitin deacetylase (PgdA/CDA1 family)|nr:polysaccharide deacetylase [Lachnospiraceae bacterium]
MERQRLRYVLGYCAAMIMIAAIWIRMETVPDASLAMEQPEESVSAGQSEGGKVSPAYQALYPDMYVEIEDVETSAKAANEEIRRLYMTFDDGPSEVTKEVVEALENAGARAAFFLIGNEITKEREELLKEMSEAGHILGIHTYSHDYKKIYGSVESYLEDFHQTYERIYEVTGKKPVYFRFPWGSINCYNKGIRQELIEEMERRGFQYFDWNVSAEDSVGKPSEYSVLHNVIDDFPKYRNAIVLMHDSNTNQISARMLPQILQTAREKGYEFGTIDELEKPYHWPNSY